jgi:hypothetical protein
MNQDNREKYIILGLTSLLLALIIIKSPICQSLWLDETITIWTASGTFSDTVSKALTYQGQSPLYFLIIKKLLEISSQEYFLRSLSLLSVLISGFIFFKLLQRWLTTNVAILGTALLISSDGVILAALSVRPYGLALLAALFATYQLLRFIDSKKNTLAIALWVTAMVGMFYLHYLFALLAIPHLLFVWSNRENLSKGQYQAFSIGTAVGILCALPGLNQILSLSNRVESLSFAKIPSLYDLLTAIFSISSLIYVIGGILFTRAIRKFNFNRDLACYGKDLLPITVWLAGAPILFFVHAHLTEHSMFVERWFLWSIPASCLILLIPFQLISERKNQFIAICMAIGFMIIREGERKWHIEDWKGAAKSLEQEAEDIPVILYSGLIELESLSWLETPERYDYLSAPILTYPIKQTPILANSNPYSFNGDYYKKVIEPVISKSSALVLITLRKRIKWDGEQFFVPELWAQQLKSAGFEKRTLLSKNSGNQVVVEKFERP